MEIMDNLQELYVIFEQNLKISQEDWVQGGLFCDQSIFKYTKAVEVQAEHYGCKSCFNQIKL